MAYGFALEMEGMVTYITLRFVGICIGFVVGMAMHSIA